MGALAGLPSYTCGAHETFHDWCKLTDVAAAVARAPSEPLDYMLPTSTNCCVRQSEYLYMIHHLDNFNLVRYRIGAHTDVVQF
jgi:hypothetical protein